MEGSEGYLLESPKEFVKKAAPVLKVTMKLLKVGSALGKCFGFPIPGVLPNMHCTITQLIVVPDLSGLAEELIPGAQTQMLDSIMECVNEEFPIPSVDELLDGTSSEDDCMLNQHTMQ